jgi:hypothetical protein
MSDFFLRSESDGRPQLRRDLARGGAVEATLRAERRKCPAASALLFDAGAQGLNDRSWVGALVVSREARRMAARGAIDCCPGGLSDEALLSFHDSTGTNPYGARDNRRCPEVRRLEREPASVRPSAPVCD